MLPILESESKFCFIWIVRSMTFPNFTEIGYRTGSHFTKKGYRTVSHFTNIVIGLFHALQNGL